MFKDSNREPALPVRLDPVSNGEVLPAASPRLRAAQELARAEAARHAWRLGVSRRAFLESAAGAATTLIAVNRVWAGTRPGGYFAVSPAMAQDPAAARTVLAGDEFVFDVQTHHVSPDRSWLPENPHFDFLNKLPQGRCSESDPLRCYSRHHFVKEIFMDSDTDVAVLSGLPAAPMTTPVTQKEMDETRRVVEMLEGWPRLRVLGQVLPNLAPLEAQLDGMQRLVEDEGVRAWKVYTQWGPNGKGFWLDDPKTGIPMIEKARKLGANVICIHKGLSLLGFDPLYAGCRDVGPVAKMFPDVQFVVYHSGFDFPFEEGAHDPKAEGGISSLVRSLHDSGIRPNTNVWAELGTTWRVVLGHPTPAAHALGKLLKFVGEDRVLWGTDCVWYGSPQDQIQAFRAFQIAPELREAHGYPELTRELKAKVFGLSAARLFGLDVADVRRRLRGDRVAQARADYANDPRPSGLTYGPRTRAQFLRHLARQTGPA
ncbi:MAG TPA: amidohydrolase family protein [Vicinamibacteria bacterium]|nr:amidohydrolase family protein [Vicinamibacteria bacterium]